MSRIGAVLLTVALLAGPVAAHHSYSAYHTDQVITIDGTLEAFEFVNPHSLLKVRTDKGVTVFEWRAINGLQRVSVDKDFFKAGERLIVTGNPHREYDTNGVANLKTLCRPSDRWSLPEGSCP
jgi:hypothetical protein